MTAEVTIAGYSGTPLVEKIGIRPGHRLAILNPPQGLDKELTPLPDGVVNADKEPLDAAILFAANKAVLKKNLRRLAGNWHPLGCCGLHGRRRVRERTRI
jgi:hypothetical protein